MLTRTQYSFILLLAMLIALPNIATGQKQRSKQKNAKSEIITMDNPINGLLERISEGASDRFTTEIVPADKEYFELEQNGDKIMVRGSNYVSIATGINWYFKYYLHIHLSWNSMKATLPATLPTVPAKERHETSIAYRYEFNFCTFSYGTAFWDWTRWEQEIDWMALHGVNMPLMLTGTETVWRNLLLELGYSKNEVNNFIAGPAFQAWWQMNNLEGWGGPNPDSWYDNQQILGNKILNRYRQYGIQPVMPGYSGMVPSNAASKLGLSVADPGTWCTFQRPAFLLPTDNRFAEIADAYYRHMKLLFGDDLKYFTADPFHEGGNVGSVDLPSAGTAIFSAMTRANSDAKWVIQSWHANPRLQMIDPMDAGKVIVLDLFSDGSPKWKTPGYGKHDWIYTMLHNFGGRTGMFGRMDFIASTFNDAVNDATAGPKLKGVGVAPEGYELDPVMYELLFELPWRNEKVNVNNWIDGYIQTRYGTNDPKLKDAWTLLEKTVYKGAAGQEGATESVLCARPALDINSVSTWGSSNISYNINDLRRTAMALLDVAENYRGNDNFEYDLVNVVSQTLADYGYNLQKSITAAYRAGDKTAFASLSSRFLNLILAQDRLLATRKEFLVGRWIEQAKSLGSTEAEKTLYEWNARTLITVWGTKNAANNGELHDYSYRSWSGLMKDVYHKRWEAYFQLLTQRLNGATVADIDFFDTYEYPWTIQKNNYPTASTGDAINIAREVFEEYSSELSICQPGGTLCVDEGQGYIAQAATAGAKTNINFTQNTRPTTVYVDATNHVISVEKGKSFTLNITADMKDGHAGVPGYRYFKWCHKFIYADWNNDQDFDDAGELLYSIPLNGNDNNAANISKTIQVPANATLGKTNLRVRYTNGYSVDINSVNGGCQAVKQGGVYDFGIEILDGEYVEPTLCKPAGSLCRDEGQGFIAQAATTGARTNLNFTQTTRPATVYVDATQHQLDVARGDNFTLNINADMKDGQAGVAGYRYFKWCHKYIYADWNNDKDFDDAGELLYSIALDGSNNLAANINKTIQVPANAVLNKVTLRVRYTNGYGIDLGAASGACADVTEGAIYDFSINISDFTEQKTVNANDILYCYPNPANNIIKFSDEVRSAILLDVNGKELARSTGDSLNISNLSKNLYIIKLIGKKNMTAHQVVIKN